MSNENAKLEYESGVTAYAMAEITDSGDHKNYTSSAALFSETSGNAPVILPNGIINGAQGIPAVSGTNNLVDVAKTLCNLNGVETTVNAATDVSLTRGVTNGYRINSVTINAAGSITVVVGTESTSFSETRGAAGGPPYIPVDSIELFQVRFTSITAGAVLAAEIFATIGTHRETTDFPGFDADNDNAEVNFKSALPLIHTGDVPKKVFASYADPVFTEQSFANDFVPAETSHSTSSTQVYNDVVGSVSSTLAAATFTAILKNGITDDIVNKKDDTIFIRFYQDRFKLPHILTQGKLGVSRTFGAADNPQVSCTVAASRKSVERAS